MERNGRRAAVVLTLDLPPRRPAECRWGNARKLQPDGGAYDRTKNRRLCLPIGAGQGEAGQPGDPRIAQASGGGISTPACLVPGGQSRHGAGREYGSAGRAGVDFGTRQKLANSAGWCPTLRSSSLLLWFRRLVRGGGFDSRPPELHLTNSTWCTSFSRPPKVGVIGIAGSVPSPCGGFESHPPAGASPARRNCECCTIRR